MAWAPVWGKPGWPPVASSLMPCYCSHCSSCVWWPQAAAGSGGEMPCGHVAWAGRTWGTLHRRFSQPGQASVCAGWRLAMGLSAVLSCPILSHPAPSHLRDPGSCRAMGGGVCQCVVAQSWISFKVNIVTLPIYATYYGWVEALDTEK